ncbi:MAG: hypothetical protein ACJ74Y_00655 [Bryobacteraceae bacterium]
MRSFYNRPFQAAASYLGISLLAAGALAAGQSNSAQEQGAQTSTPQVASSGGWKRVGDGPDQGPPPAASVDNNVAGQSEVAPGQNQPMDPEPMPPAGASQNQGPQPYGQAGDNGAPYQQTPTYGAPAAPYSQAQPMYPQGQPNYPPPANYPQGPAPYGPVAPQSAVPPQLSVAPGTFITVRVNQFLSSDRNQQGDPFSASLIQPLVVNGVVVAEPGQTIAGRVVEVQKAGRVEGTSRLRVELTELTLVDGQQIPIQTQLIDRRGDTSVGRDVAGVAGTAGLGAAIGAAAGWGRGAAIGAGAGAAVGVLGVLITRGEPSVIVPEQALTFRLEAPVTIYTDRAPQAFRYVQPNEYNRPTYSQSPYPATPPQYSAAPYARPYPYYGPAYYGYPYYSPFYYGPTFSIFMGSRYYGRPYVYARPGFYGRPFHR